MPENIKLFLLDSESKNEHNNYEKKDKSRSETVSLKEKSTLLKQFFIDNPMSFINLLKSSKNEKDLDDIKEHVIDEFYGGHSNEQVVIELLQESEHIDDKHKKKEVQEQCTGQSCIFGFIMNEDNEYVGVVNARGTIKMFHEMEKEKNINKKIIKNKKGINEWKSKNEEEHESYDLKALYEPFRVTVRKRNKNHHELLGLDEEDEDEDEKIDAKEKHVKFSDKLKLSLKKLKGEFKAPDIKKIKINYNNVIGQVVDKTKKYTRAIIIKSKDYGQRLIIVQPTEVLKGIPVFAVLDTHL